MSSTVLTRWPVSPDLSGVGRSDCGKAANVETVVGHANGPWTVDGLDRLAHAAALEGPGVVVIEPHGADLKFKPPRAPTPLPAPRQCHLRSICLERSHARVAGRSRYAQEHRASTTAVGIRILRGDMGCAIGTAFAGRDSCSTLSRTVRFGMCRSNGGTAIGFRRVTRRATLLTSRPREPIRGISGARKPR